MKNMDVRSMLIGILLSVLIITTLGASGDGRTERFQLHNMMRFEDGNAPTPKVMDGDTAVSMSGVLKIDSNSGQVWALSLRNNKADRWIEIK